PKNKRPCEFDGNSQGRSDLLTILRKSRETGVWTQSQAETYDHEFRLVLPPQNECAVIHKSAFFLAMVEPFGILHLLVGSGFIMSTRFRLHATSFLGVLPTHTFWLGCLTAPGARSFLVNVIG